jgi:hypothetical protein
MIGELNFTLGRRRVTAQLTERLTWHCDDAALQDYLNRTLPPDHRAQEKPLHFLYQAAERLGAEVHVPEPV